MRWKSGSWILISVLLAACTISATAQIATTTVTDTIYHADGTPATGTVILSWPAFTTSSGDVIPTGNTSATIAAGGALSVQLVPNAAATPIGTYYTVVYHLDDGSVTRQYWVVPASVTPVTVSAIESTVLPTSIAMQTVSKSYVDTAIAAAVTGHPLDSSPFVQKTGDSMTGPLLLPADPVSAAQAADKHYVDASVAAATAGMAQNAGTPPSTQYAIPAYLLSPSGGMASPGPTHLAVDATGYNLSGYRAGFTSLGINPAQADCTQIGGLFGGSSCLGLNATYGSYTFNAPNHIGETVSLTSFGPGMSLGNDGGWRTDFPVQVIDNNLVRGIHDGTVNAVSGSAVGDSSWNYVFDYSAGGTAAPSDEGLTVAGTYEGGESYGYAHFVVAAGGRGSTTPTFTAGGTGCGAFNNCNPVDGGILLDTQTAVASGSLNGASSVWPGSGSVVPLKTIPVAGVTLPVTTAWGYANGVSITPGVVRNAPAAETVALTMVSGSFAPGDPVCVEGTATVGGFDEQSTIASVNGGNVTLPLAYPYTNIAIFKGGPCGTYISFSADLALNGYRTTYHAIASFTGSDLIFAVPSGGGLNQELNGGALPQTGAEPETYGGVSDPTAAFQTFCGAEIVANLSAGNNPQIDPNVCAWAPGDTVESPHFPTQSVKGGLMLVNQNMPANGQGVGGWYKSIGGAGFATGDAFGDWTVNTNADSMYTSDGGWAAPPRCTYCTSGTWYDSLAVAEAPTDAMLKVLGHIPGQTSYKLLDDATSGGWGSITLTKGSGFSFSAPINCASCGFTGSGVAVSASMDAISTGSAAEMSVIDGDSRSPHVTIAGRQGNTVLRLGGVPYAATGPVTPLFDLDTNQNYPSNFGLSLVAYNGGGSPVPVLFVHSGPSIGDTNMTLENGTTACATLLCLGPALTVNSSGAVTLAGAPAGSYLKADGGGYGTPDAPGVGGSGTAGYLPAWAGATALGNSHVDDGVSTAGTVTISEPVNVASGALNLTVPTGAGTGDVALTFTPYGADQWLNTAEGGGSGGTPSAYSFYDVTSNKTPVIFYSHGGTTRVNTFSTGVFGWNSDTNYADAAPDTGLSRDAAGTVDVGNGTAGDKSGAINAALYKGPATAPVGACSVVGWTFSQDGHATFCNGSAWVTKI